MMTVPVAISIILAIALRAPAENSEPGSDSEEYVLPPYLLHAGSKSVLLEDVRQGSISLEVWDKFNMAGNGNFDGLPPLLYCENYGNG